MLLVQKRKEQNRQEMNIIRQSHKTFTNYDYYISYLNIQDEILKQQNDLKNLSSYAKRNKSNFRYAYVK